MNAHKLYKQTQQETASPERLMVLLFEAALRHMRLGAQALDEKRYADSTHSLTRASDIVASLKSSLDHRHAPELCAQLDSLYSFVALRLTRASLGRNASLAREAERVFAPIVDAFQQAVVLAKAKS
jgi:flagellar protein FliS